MTATNDRLRLAALLQERYGQPPEPLTLPENDVLRTLLAHRSVRAYLDRPLPAGTLELLVAAAQSAATSSNLQTWSVVAVQDPVRKERLATLAGNQAHIRQSPLLLVWLADLGRLCRTAAAYELPHAGLDYLEMFLMAAIDASLAAQNAVIAAEALGLGTVYIGALRNRPLEVAAELSLPPKAFAVFGLCVGYPDPEHPAAVKPRLPQATVLHQETYSQAREAEAVAAYNVTMADFYQSQGMVIEGTWAEHSSRRVASAASLAGRASLTEILHTLGFPLQ